MITQILDFGLPAPLDIQITGADIPHDRQVADDILQRVRNVPGVVDARPTCRPPMILACCA